jgi:hypothetical protein
MDEREKDEAVIAASASSKLDVLNVVEERIKQLRGLIATNSYATQWLAWNDMLIRYIELRERLC